MTPRAALALRRFPLTPRGPVRPLSICIITFEAVNFWRNGGIATVSTGLAELLARAGHRVTLALTRADMLTPDQFQAAAERYLAQGIEVVAISRARVEPIEGPLAEFTAWERFAAYDWLKTRHFDVVHTSEHLGEALYCIAAKKLGLAFRRTQFWVGCHGPSAWVIEANEEPATDEFWVWTDASERFVLREADVVWTPSRYLVDWMTRKGFSLPDGRLFQQTYYIPNDLGDVRQPAPSDTGEVRELIFFGRLEPRKGVKLFVSAVLSLRERLDGVTITFMGRQSRIDGLPAERYIVAQLEGSDLDWRIIDDLDRVGAYTHVMQPGRVAVLASPVDNSPCAVYELLEIGARFLACAGGGIPELLDPSCHERVLFDYTVDSLVTRLGAVLDALPAAPVAAPPLDRRATENAWVAAHDVIFDEMSVPAATGAASQDRATFALVVDQVSPALEVSLEAIRWLGSLAARVFLVVSDRRAVLPHDLHPEAERLSLDALNQAQLLAALAAPGLPVIVLRTGVAAGPEACNRLLQAVTNADAVVPFSFRNDPAGGGRIVEPVLPGDWAWSMRHGAARYGGAMSQAALAALREMPAPPGSNPLVWFDVAALSGLGVLPLPEALLDATRSARDMHEQADARARQIVCSERMPAGQRIMMEIGLQSMRGPRTEGVPASADVPVAVPEAAEAEADASPSASKASFCSRLAQRLRRSRRAG